MALTGGIDDRQITKTHKIPEKQIENAHFLSRYKTVQVYYYTVYVAIWGAREVIDRGRKKIPQYDTVVLNYAESTGIIARVRRRFTCLRHAG